jgi:hypothetical protein
MPKQSSKRVTKIPSKKLNPTITVALIALVGTLLTALFSSPVIIAWLQRTPAPPAQTSPPSTTPALSVQTNPPSTTPIISGEIPTPSSTASVSVVSGGDEGCLAQFLLQNNIDPTKRQINIEVGAHNQYYNLSNQDISGQSFIGPFGIKLTQYGKMIAALSFLYFPESNLFKITSLVDANCKDVAEYSNTTQGGDRNALNSYEDLKIQLAEGTFLFSPISYGTGYFYFDFTESE